MSQQVVWFFGRGLSIACGLRWDVPPAWQDLARYEKIERICATLLAEMDSPQVRTAVISRFLKFLAGRTASGWRHLFLTTNWDFLLQREVLRSIHDNTQPPWLSNGHVFHLNGTVERSTNSAYRSPFLLPEDSYMQRCPTPEANVAYNKMIWGKHIVVVGVSFECETDRFLLQALRKVEDDLPIGESTWFVVNPDLDSLTTVCRRIQAALPQGTIVPIPRTFESWQDEGFSELRSRGIFA